MFNELIKAFRKAIERIARAFREFLQQMRCVRHEHNYSIEAWRYSDYKRAIIARVKCTHCGAVDQKIIHDPRTISRIKKRAGALRVERWKRV